MLSGFLEVDKSLSNRKWVGPTSQQERLATSLVQQHGVSQLTALLSVKRGVVSDDLASYLSPKLKSLMPDPYVLQDMQTGAERLIKALTQKENICIFADYDVDGTVSASILLLWLKFFDITPNIYIPDRIKEGYGPNVSAMEAIAKKNSLIICVDCGTASHQAIKKAMEHGAEVLVLDHHIADEHLPEALAIINPKRKDDSSELDYLCAAGVVFIFLVAVSRILRERQIRSPEIISFLDLVALATVADVVPLIKLNRAFVTQGLKILTHRNRPGLVALIDEAGIKSQPTTYHLGYLIAPRINAAGRLADAKFAIQLLTETSEQNAKKVSAELNELNIKRRSLENEVLNAAIAQVETKDEKSIHLTWVAGYNWHPGVIGIVAARLKEKFSVPAIVFSINKDGLAVGSARSISGIDIGSEIKKLVISGLFLSGGGHSMAAGLKANQNQLADSMRVLELNLGKISKKPKIANELEIDCLISAAGATTEIVEEISAAGPFGSGNPAPIVAIANCQIKYLKVLVDKHIKFNCLDPTGKKLEAIFFNGVETVAGQRVMKNMGESFHICGRLEINDWGGYRRVVLQVEDIATI